jgi:hypothetical protein
LAFALWIDTGEQLAWAQGTHEYRPWGAAVVAVRDQFRLRDFSPTRRAPLRLRRTAFAGFYGSLEEVNEALRSPSPPKLGPTPMHVR